MLKFFAVKMWVAFAGQKLLTFLAKNIRILYIESAKTVNEMTLNKLIKLKRLWTTGPRIMLLSGGLCMKHDLEFTPALHIWLPVKHIFCTVMYHIYLKCSDTITLYAANSAGNKSMIFFIFFTKNKLWHFLRRQCARNSVKNKKNISNCCLLQKMEKIRKLIMHTSVPSSEYFLRVWIF